MGATVGMGGSVPSVVDAQFADARLAVLYDVFDGPRDDLNAYARIVRELGASSVLDVGCGTGSFSLLAAAMGLAVTGVDPAEASVDVARRKAGASEVEWCVGTVADAPAGPFDLAVMTGNVAQVFLADDEWLATLREIRRRLSPSGHLVFETRRPEARAWEAWAGPFEASSTFSGVGLVRQSRQLLDVDLPRVSFRWRYSFPDGEVLDSDSTLVFRSDEENRALLQAAGFDVVDVRDAPDRPGLELVYLATPQEHSR